jgi:hypothetical protein
MGSLLQNRTPAQLAWIVAASDLFVTSSFATFVVEAYYHPNRHRLPLWASLASFALLILGLVIGLFAEAALKDGIASEHWPDALVAGTRKLFTHPALAAVMFILVAASIAVVAFSNSRHFAGAWIFLFPAMSLTRVKAVFTRPRNSASGPGTIGPPKPLQSDHWGIPPESPSH